MGDSCTCTTRGIDYFNVTSNQKTEKYIIINNENSVLSI